MLEFSSRILRRSGVLGARSLGNVPSSRICVFGSFSRSRATMAEMPRAMSWGRLRGRCHDVVHPDHQYSHARTDPVDGAILELPENVRGLTAGNADVDRAQGNKLLLPNRLADVKPAASDGITNESTSNLSA